MAMYELTDTLEEEIKRLQEKLKTLDPASDAYKAINSQLKEMYSLRLSQFKEEVEIEERASKTEAELAIREKELAFNEKQHQDELATKKKDRIHGWIHTGVDILLTVVRVGGTVVGTAMMLDQGYRFEEGGKPVSSTFRDARKGISDALNSLKKK